jgi:shikimate dehydrogenase
MTTRVGVIGWPLDHSVSPAMHNAAFAALGLAWHYHALPVPPEQLAATIRQLVAAGYRGANVTIPHKEAVLPLMDELSAGAQGIGAVNTIVVQPDGRLVGDNTDWLGFLHPLDQRGFDLAGRRVLLLGAGGAARGVAYALGQRGVREVAIWNRTAARASELAAHIGSTFSGLTVTTRHDLRELVSAGTTLVVNTTPAGMWPGDGESPWPDGLALPASALAYDLVYRPEQTRFLRQAEQAGCPTQGGLDMLVVQGALAFELWTGQWPPVDVMMAVARESLMG